METIKLEGDHLAAVNEPCNALDSFRTALCGLNERTLLFGNEGTAPVVRELLQSALQSAIDESLAKIIGVFDESRPDLAGRIKDVDSTYLFEHDVVFLHVSDDEPDL